MSQILFCEACIGLIKQITWKNKCEILNRSYLILYIINNLQIFKFMSFNSLFISHSFPFKLKYETVWLIFYFLALRVQKSSRNIYGLGSSVENFYVKIKNIFAHLMLEIPQLEVHSNVSSNSFSKISLSASRR